MKKKSVMSCFAGLVAAYLALPLSAGPVDLSDCFEPTVVGVPPV